MDRKEILEIQIDGYKTEIMKISKYKELSDLNKSYLEKLFNAYYEAKLELEKLK